MTWFYIMVAAIVAVWLYARIQNKASTGKAETQRLKSNSTSGIAEKIRGDGSYSLNVVGESNYQDELDQICGGKTEDGHDKYLSASLTPEPSNPYDSNAIRVEIEGATVGYLDRATANRYKSIVGDSTISKCPAVVRGGWKRKGRSNKEGHYGVSLDLNV